MEKSSGFEGSGSVPTQERGARPEVLSTKTRRLLEAAARLADEGQDLELNCRELDELGGSALTVLFALAAELERRGVRLTLRDAGPTIARFIAVAGARPDRLQI